MLGDSFSSVFMKKALDGTWQRQKAISSNIANHETPGYKAVKVNFEDALKSEMKQLGSAPVTKSEIVKKMNVNDKTKIRLYQDHSGSERADGNNVNMEDENILMAKAQIQYQFLTKKISDHYARLRYAISEGKR